MSFEIQKKNIQMSNKYLKNPNISLWISNILFIHLICFQIQILLFDFVFQQNSFRCQRKRKFGIHKINWILTNILDVTE